MWAYWQGEYKLLEELRIPANDRSVFFGDAVYEVVRVYDGELFLWPAHLERLRQSIAAMDFNCEGLEALEGVCHELASRSGLGTGIVYIQISRGNGPRRHDYRELDLTPNVLLFAEELERKKVNEDFRVLVYPDERWQRCRIKTTNLLPNVLGLQAAKDANCAEVLLYDREERVLECSHSSVFFVKDGSLITAPLSLNILPGITRAHVIETARSVGIEVFERAIYRRELAAMDAAFITNTTCEVQPIRATDCGIEYPIEHAVYRALASAFPTGRS